MAGFSYTAKDRQGKTVRDSLEAVDRKDAVRKLRSRGLTPIKVKPEAGGSPSVKNKADGLKPLHKKAKGSEKKSDKKVKVSRRHVLTFLKNFHELHKSGLPISEALGMLANRIKDPYQKQINRRLLRSVKEGKSFSDALGDLDGIFSESQINLIGAGEVTGNLHEVLIRLIEYMERRRELKSKVLASMLYPCFILVLALVVVFVFLFVLMPKMENLFAAMGGNLPFATRLLIGLADGMIYYGPFIIGGAVFVALSTLSWYKTSKGKMVLDRFLLQIPFIGNLIIYSETTQITQTLGLLLENGVITVDAFKLTEKTVNNAYISAVFKDARQNVLEGIAVSTALEGMDVMPDIMVDLISVSENTGSLVNGFYEVTKMFQERLTKALGFLVGAFTTGILLVAFGFVVLIAFGIVSAVLSVSTSLGS